MAVLECQDVCMHFGALAAVDMVSFTLRSGEILGMIGPNGAGKTTLFNCIIGLYRPTGGRVMFDGTDITGMKPHQVCRLGLAKTSQIMEPFRGMTVFENVLVAAMHGGRMPSPVNRFRLKPQMRGNTGESIACGPAHDC